MKNRVKNLFIAGLMLASMGLATVVQAEVAWGVSYNSAKSACSAMSGTWSYRGSAGAVCTGVANQYSGTCGNYGGSYDGKNCTWASVDTSSAANSSNTNSSSNTTSGDPTTNTGNGSTGTGTSSTEIKQVGEYEYGAGLDHEDEFNTSIIDCDSGANGEGIFCLLNIGLTVLTWGIGIAGTLGIVITGIQYLTARDSVEQMTKAKNRLINIIVGLVVYAVMWGFLNWLIPGGLF